LLEKKSFEVTEGIYFLVENTTKAGESAAVLLPLLAPNGREVQALMANGLWEGAD